MKHLSIFVAACTALFLYSTLSAQTPENLEDTLVVETSKINEKTDSGLKPKKLKKKGDANFANLNFEEASENYDEALGKINPKKRKKVVYFNYQTGVSYLNQRDYEQAKRNFLAAKEADKKGKNALILYQLANAKKYLAEYEEAKKTYREFVMKAGDSNKFDYEKKRARLEMKGCDYGDTLEVEEPDYTVTNPGENVNGKFADFGPTIRGNSLVFSKINHDGTFETADKGSEHLSRLYVSDVKNNKFSVALLFSETLNEGKFYVGNPSFTPDGNTVYFTRCDMVEKVGTICAIYTSSLSGGVWDAPKKLGSNVNVDGTNTTQPNINIAKDGKEILFFVAERPTGGRGGKDIWFAEKGENGEFGRARNLGYPVNTQYDEVSPFFHAETNTLYFSSNGHVSLGGFDVFKTERDEEGKFQEPVNLGTPVNTSVDDYDFVLSEDGTFGFLASNRVGSFSEKSPTCCDDIYYVQSTNVSLFAKGLVYVEREGSRFVLDNADLKLKDNEGKVQTAKFDGKSFMFELEQDKKYDLSAKSSGHVESGVSFTTRGLTKSDTLQFDIVLKPETLVGFLIGTIYYEFASSTLTPEAPQTLKKVVDFLKENPETVVEVGSHTDSYGTAEFNIGLSKRRSEAATNYLISQGIKKDRLVSKWYGLENPIAPNTNKDGSDNEEGRAINRRTEFTVIKLIEKK
jgi:OmpA-OmpF porin, OOP family